MPNNDYFHYIDERMIELGIKEEVIKSKEKGKKFKRFNKEMIIIDNTYSGTTTFNDKSR
jgi:hypothetical protein